VGDFDEAAIRKLLHLPEQHRPIALVPLGFPDESPNPRWRRPLSEVIQYYE
jgi:nitroreductase